MAPVPGRQIISSLTALAVVVVCVGACGNDGPQQPTATRSSTIEAAVQSRLASADRAGAGGETAPASTPPAPDADTEPAPDARDGGAAGPGVVGGVGELEQATAMTTLPPAERPPLPATAAVIGDSIARSAHDLVSSSISLSGIELVGYDARDSRRMATWGGSDLPSGVAAIGDILGRGNEPDLWIVALGTNDVGAGTDQQTIEDDIDEVLDLIPDDAAVLWIDTWVRDLDDRAGMVNLLLRARLADRPDAWVLNWHDLAATEGLIADDGVHLTERGQLEYARMVGRALRDLFDPDRKQI